MNRAPKIHTCEIGDPPCGKQFTKGGRAGGNGKKAACPMHYTRERRGAVGAELVAPAHEKGQGERKPVMFRPSAEVLKKLEKALKRQAKGTGGPFPEKRRISMGQLVERACTEALAVWFPAGV